MSINPDSIKFSNPNLSSLGEREQSQYGKKDYKFLEENCLNRAKELKIDLELKQSNVEGEIVNIIQEARNAYDGIIINAGGYLFFLDSGSMDVTNEFYPDGTGETFSMTGLCVRGTYGRRVTNRLRIGFTGKYIREQIYTTHMQSFALHLDLIVAHPLKTPEDF